MGGEQIPRFRARNAPVKGGPFAPVEREDGGFVQQFPLIEPCFQRASMLEVHADHITWSPPEDYSTSVSTILIANILDVEFLKSACYTQPMWSGQFLLTLQGTGPVYLGPVTWTNADPESGQMEGLFRWTADALIARGKHSRGEPTDQVGGMEADLVRARRGGTSPVRIVHEDAERLEIKLRAFPKELLAFGGGAIALAIIGLLGGPGLASALIPVSGLFLLGLWFGHRRWVSLTFDKTGLTVSRYRSTVVPWSELNDVVIHPPSALSIGTVRGQALRLVMRSSPDVAIVLSLGGSRGSVLTEDHLRWLRNELLRRAQLST